MRGYDYLSFVGQNAFFLNAELRFPLIEAMATPIGILGGIRGTFFANMGGAYVGGHSRSRSGPNNTTIERPIIGYDQRRRPGRPIYGAAVPIDGFRLRRRARVLRHQPADLRARLPRALRLVVEDAVQQGLGRRRLRLQGGSNEFRKVKFSVWIGYDF